MLTVVAITLTVANVPSPGRALLESSQDAHLLAARLTSETDDTTHAGSTQRRVAWALHGRRVEALRDGHGKVYYLVWGIVDWVIAGNLWAASASMLFTAAAMPSSPTNESPTYGSSSYGSSYPDPYYDSPSAQRSDMRTPLCIAAVVSGLVGGIVAWRAGTNIGTYRELGREEYGLREP